MSVPVWLTVTLCTVAVDVRVKPLILVKFKVNISSVLSKPIELKAVYPISPVPCELRDQKSCPVVEVVQVNTTVSPGHTGVYEGEL